MVDGSIEGDTSSRKPVNLFQTIAKSVVKDRAARKLRAAALSTMTHGNGDVFGDVDGDDAIYADAGDEDDDDDDSDDAYGQKLTRMSAEQSGSITQLQQVR